MRGTRSRLPFAVGGAAVALCALAIAETAATAPADSRWQRALLAALIVGVPMAAGVYGLMSPQTFRFGAMLAGSGAAWSLTTFGNSSDSLLYSVGRVSAWLIFPLITYLMLAYPDGRLAPGIDRTLFGGVTALITVLFVGSALFVEAYPTQTPWASCDANCPANAFLVLDDEPAIMDALVRPLRELLAVVLLVGVAASRIARYRTAPPLQRRIIGPVVVASLVSVITLTLYLVVRRAAPDGEAADALGWVWAMTIPAIAAAFLIGLVRRRTMVGEVLARVSLELSRGLDRARLRSTLAAALADPSVDVLVPDELPGRWRDADDRLTSGSQVSASGRALTPIADEDRVIAGLVHDTALDGELLSSVRSLVLATVRHERLVDELAGSLHDLELSRKRIARAADLERSRIERDLHDGAQQRLIALRIKLSVAEELALTDPQAGADAVHAIGDEIEETLEELRALAHGVYPSVLGDRGLKDALRTVLSRSPIPARLLARDITRYPPEVETAVYYTCLEAVQNAFKHAGRASGVWVSLRENHELRFEVRDDGVGFVPPDGEYNGGLGNMRDRVEAVGGHLTIDSAPGHGTRIRGTVPLP
ncbi:MAG TPA: sensor histidine kinase [Solirubrobacteraceae bacterium]|nr:sensor histidine kinase [Solirubrobacteraceae bacterium]